VVQFDLRVIENLHKYKEVSRSTKARVRGGVTNVIDDDEKFLGGVLDRLDVVRLNRSQTGFQKETTEGDHGVEWCADLRSKRRKSVYNGHS
jgi:hypothetical protein